MIDLLSLFLRLLLRRLSQLLLSTAWSHNISGQALSSHSIVPSSRTVRPCSPWGGRWIGHWRTTWSTICSSVPQSQAAEGAIPPFLLTGAETSDTGAEAIKPDPRCFWEGHSRRVGGCRGWKYGVSCVVRPLRIPLVIRPLRRTYVVVVVSWTDKLLCDGYKWMCRFGTPCTPTWWIDEKWSSSADRVPATIGRLSAGVGRRHPFARRKASLMVGSMRRVWALRHQTGTQYSVVEWTRASVAVRNVVALAPQSEPASRLKSATRDVNFLQIDSWCRRYVSDLSNLAPGYLGSE